MNDPTNDNSSQSDGSNADGTNPDGINPDASAEAQGQDAKETSTEPTVEIPAHEAELTKVRAERDLLEQKLQRAMADTQNIRRRQRQEMDDSRRRVAEGMTQ